MITAVEGEGCGEMRLNPDSGPGLGVTTMPLTGMGQSCPTVPPDPAFTEEKLRPSSFPSRVPDSSQRVCSIKHSRILKIFPPGSQSPSKSPPLPSRSFHWDPAIKGSDWGRGEAICREGRGPWAAQVHHPPPSSKKHHHCCHILCVGFSTQWEGMLGVETTGS